MKKILYMLILVFLFNLNININSATDTNQKYKALKSGEFLEVLSYNDVVNHGEDITFNYMISSELQIADILFEYGCNNLIDIQYKFEEENYFTTTINLENIGEYRVIIYCYLTLNDGEKIVLDDYIYIYSTTDYDYVSVASIGEAKFLQKLNQENVNQLNISNMDVNYNDEINIQSTSNSITVSGKIQWVNDAGGLNDAKFLRIQVLDDDILFSDVLGDCYTDSDGTYEITVSNSGFLESGTNDIKLKLIPDSPYATIKSSNIFRDYYIYTPSYNDNEESELTIDYIINPDSLLNKGVDEDIINSFMIHQVIILGGDYFVSKERYRLPKIDVIFPTNYNTTAYYNEKIHILSEDKEDWDVILHEYGHYIRISLGLYESPGFSHSYSDCLNARYGSKEEGMPLAWEEGWANYFSISAQLESRADLLNMNNYGDLVYSDLKYNGQGNVDTQNSFSYNIEFYDDRDNFKGESNELVISIALFDFADYSSDEDVYLSYTTIWNLINHNDCNDFSEFINCLYENKNFSDTFNYGEILTNFLISPDPVNPWNNYYLSWDKPQFNWGAYGGTGSYQNNEFSIVFLDDQKNLILETESIDNTNYNLSNEEWTEIITKSEDYFYYAIKGYQTNDFVTGPYYSEYHKVYIPQENVIYEGETIQCASNYYDCVWYVFEAPTTGTFIFESSGSTDTIGGLHQYIDYGHEDLNLISGTYDDNSGENNNFKIVYNLAVGEVVYLRVRCSDWSNWIECSVQVYLTEHIHGYTHGVAQYSSSMHKLLCVCGGYSCEVHITDPTITGRYKHCLKCGYMVDTGGNITIQPVQCIEGGKK